MEVVVPTNYLRRSVALGLILCFAMPAVQPALAQDEEQLEEVLVVVGSRRRDRSAADSPVPVDVVGGEELRSVGDTDMDSLIAALVPSYNVDQQPISDAGTVIRPASLRALPSDATLVLLNGKRRHRASVITFLGGGISDGAQAPDLSVIPAIALDRVEVLRDGASAQYGSDAIAGVMNLVLRSDRQGGGVEARWGRFYEGDGDGGMIAANIGLPLMDAGFLNLSAEVKQVDPTSRSVQRADAMALIDAGNTAVRQPASQIWGAPEIRDDFKLFANAGIDVGESSELYAFGNWAQRTVEGGFFFRNPHTRGGVFRGDGLADGTPTVKVADLSADGMSGNCPALPVVGNVVDATALAAVQAAPDCFSFIEIFPGGFTPQFGGDVEDMSIAFGLRGEMAHGWRYDLSYVYGSNEVQHFMHNTINPQLAGQRENIPTTYFPGNYIETDRVFDANLSKPLDLGWHAPLHLALGFEYRDETFERQAGDLNSHFIDERLANQGFGIGSNGFPGLAPRHAGEDTRGSYALYIDGETNVNDRLLLGAAARYEDYEDFGDTLDGKFAIRYELTDTLAVRGSVSTGFRAPTVGQSNVRNVTTAFANGMLSDEATLPPTHPISVQKGGLPLQPEESVNTTLGTVFSLGEVDFTVDYYSIAVEGRIARTSFLPLTPEDISALSALGVRDASSFAGVLFFTNDFDTTTRGLDVVITAPLELGMSGDTTLTVVGNRNDTNVDKRNPDIIDDLRVSQLKSTIPGNRVSVTLNHLQGNWRFMGRYRRYGEFYGAPANVESWGAAYEARWFLDGEAAYTFNDRMTLVLGAQNLLDEYPQTTAQAAQDAVGMLYPENAPYGFNGGYYYLRAVWNFD